MIQEDNNKINRILAKRVFIMIAFFAVARWVGQVGAVASRWLSLVFEWFPDGIIQLAFISIFSVLFIWYNKGNDTLFRVPTIRDNRVFVVMFIMYIVKALFYENKLIPVSEAIETACFAIIEEIEFRGLLLTWGMQKVNSRNSLFGLLLFQCLLFGFCHITNYVAGNSMAYTLVQMIGACGIGMVYGIIYLKSKSIWPTCVLHFLNNYACAVQDRNGFGFDSVFTGNKYWLYFMGLLVSVVFLIRFVYKRLSCQRQFKRIINLWNEKTEKRKRLGSKSIQADH